METPFETPVETPQTNSEAMSVEKQIEQLCAENKQLRAENEQMYTELLKLRAENYQYAERDQKWQQTCDMLQKECNSLNAIIEQIQIDYNDLSNEYKKLENHSSELYMKLMGLEENSSSVPASNKPQVSVKFEDSLYSYDCVYDICNSFGIKDNKINEIADDFWEMYSKESKVDSYGNPALSYEKARELFNKHANDIGDDRKDALMKFFHKP